jgi:UDP-N-acetylglucosamine 3-dehydrogenase
MSNPPLRAGLVGLGVMGRNHARVFDSLPDFEFVGIADPRADELGVPARTPIVEHVDDLIALGLDVCAIAAPTKYHEEAALALAEAGIHTLVEKPLAPDGPAGERIAEAFASRGLVGAVGHIERFNPALQQLRARLDDGQLGEVYQIVTRRQSPFPSRIADVGVVFDLATHDIDSTAWVAGHPFASVSARTGHKSGRDHEDLVAIVGQLDDGTVTSHLINWLSPFKERVTVAIGERGSFVADTVNAELTFHANGSIEMEWESLSMFKGVSEGDTIRYAFPKPEPLRTEHLTFARAVRGERDAGIVTMDQGLQVVRVAEAVLRSAETGTTVAV